MPEYEYVTHKLDYQTPPPKPPAFVWWRFVALAFILFLLFFGFILLLDRLGRK